MGSNKVLPVIGKHNYAVGATFLISCKSLRRDDLRDIFVMEDGTYLKTKLQDSCIEALENILKQSDESRDRDKAARAFQWWEDCDSDFEWDVIPVLARLGVNIHVKIETLKTKTIALTGRDQEQAVNITELEVVGFS